MIFYFLNSKKVSFLEKENINLSGKTWSA